MAERGFGVLSGARVVLGLGFVNWVFFRDQVAKELSLPGVNKFLALYLLALEAIRARTKGLTLGLRLTANLVAGKLIGSLCTLGVAWFPLSCAFSLMETAVRLLQAFIFSLLAVMYWVGTLVR